MHCIADEFGIARAARKMAARRCPKCGCNRHNDKNSRRQLKAACWAGSHQKG